MLGLYWGCLIGGILFAVVSVVLGDLISNAVDGMLDFLSVDFLKPTVVATWITGFGGTGILLGEYTPLNAVLVFLASLLIAVVLAAIMFVAYVKPMENSENSTAFSVQDLTGKIGEVSVAVPHDGYGEIVVKIGAGNTNQIGASFDRTDIAAGTRVVVVEVKEGTLFVSPLK